ncbi:glutathione S-transferase [Pikeienuella piscinae]|uniref:Glutathione S-transferase n=1 Tax=Pikeienuella piscinae TaxID=2748098 RepID=A0A7L5C067_9RHOB|nr:glutathione S-transferase [Pikeienuella piscinae]QIE56478.1 glutathione S-transferase [Pikeienuella piscinae]
MQLFHAGPSPYVRKVMVLLEEAGKTGEIALIDGATAPTAPNEALIAANPLGKIPCLVRDDGPALYDSRVITRYLDAKYGTGLYLDGEAVWLTLALEAHADGVLDAALLCVYEVRMREEAGRSAAWVAGQRGKITRGLDALEARWLDHLSSHVDMGAVAVACVLGYLDFRGEMGGWGDWRDGRPGLAAWGEAFLKRPAMRATAP